jgi:helicase
LTEEEVAFRLLRGEMEEVSPTYGIEETSEDFAANTVVCRGKESDVVRIGEMMVGYGEDPMLELLRYKLVRKNGDVLELSPLGRVMAEQFIGVEKLVEIDRLVRLMDDPLELVAEIECAEEERNKVKLRTCRKTSEKKEYDWMIGKKSLTAMTSKKKSRSDIS